MFSMLYDRHCEGFFCRLVGLSSSKVCNDDFASSDGNTRPPHPLSPGGYSQKIWVGMCGPLRSQNPYPIYDQNGGKMAKIDINL